MSEPTNLTASNLDLVVTGAGGFIGRAVVRAALDSGYRVRAILRIGGHLPIVHQNLKVHAIGLNPTPELVQVLTGADAVVHLAAATEGDYERQFADTVSATQDLLRAMTQAGLHRLVGISSFAVYDYSQLEEGSLLDEGSPLEVDSGRRSVYARAKGAQEAILRAHGAIILRPGIVYAADRFWQYFLGRSLGNRAWLLLGPDAEIPLVHVDDVAQAVLLAAQATIPRGSVINLVEDAPPRRWQLLQRLNSVAIRPRHILRFPWPLHFWLAGAIRSLSGSRRKLPGLVDPAELEVRFKALHYSNAAAKALLGWQPHRRAMAEAGTKAN